MKKLMILTLIFISSCAPSQKMVSQNKEAETKIEKSRMPASVSGPVDEFLEEIENAPARRY